MFSIKEVKIRQSFKQEYLKPLINSFFLVKNYKIIFEYVFVFIKICKFLNKTKQRGHLLQYKK